jgi:hypothetical protein
VVILTIIQAEESLEFKLNISRNKKYLNQDQQELWSMGQIKVKSSYKLDRNTLPRAWNS